MPDLTVIEPEPLGADVIETLEYVMAKARNGEISSVALAYVYRDGRAGRTWSQAPCFAALLGAIARLAHCLNLDKDGE